MRNLEIYTVYCKPKDYPDEYVVRKYTIIDGEPIPDKELFFRAMDIDTIHDRMIEMCLTIIPRGQEDDSTIVCSYI